MKLALEFGGWNIRAGGRWHAADSGTRPGERDPVWDACGRGAEEVGFEPTVPLRTHAISSRAH